MTSTPLGPAAELPELARAAPAGAAGRTDWMYARGLPLALAANAILWVGPYWAWTTPMFFRLSVVLVAVAFIFTLGAVRTSFTPRNTLLVLFLLGLFLYFGTHRYGGPFTVSSGWLAVLVLVLMDDRIKETTLRYFTIAFAISLVPGLIVLGLSVLGVDVPWHALVPKRFDYDILLGRVPGFFRGYPGSVVLNDQVFPLGGGEIFRLSGMYDEPGVVGTFCGLLLVADGLRIKGRLQNAILLAGGLLSFSLAFYVIMLLYFLLRRPIIATALMLAAGVTVLATSLGNSAFVQLVFLNRLRYAGGRFLGDNRVTELFTALYEDFWNADLPTRLFGSPHDVAVLVNTGTFSYKIVIYAYGLFGMAALVAFLVAAATSVSRSRAALTLLIIFLLSIYQRPNVLDLPYLLVLLGGVVQLKYREELVPAGGLQLASSAGSAG